MYKKILIGLSLLGGLIFLVGGIAYYNLTIVQVIFTNQSTFPIYNTEIWAANELKWHGDLLPKKEISKRLFPEQDGYILVRGTWQGKAIESPKFGYLTHGMGGMHEIILMPDGEFEYKQ